MKTHQCRCNGTKRKRRREGGRGHILYLKGQVGEWLPRQPQWQHWGELWLMHELDEVGSEWAEWDPVGIEHKLKTSDESRQAICVCETMVAEDGAEEQNIVVDSALSKGDTTEGCWVLGSWDGMGVERRRAWAFISFGQRVSARAQIERPSEALSQTRRLLRLPR